MSSLYMVATPIGNLEDISERAKRILSSVEAVACEDTRHTAILLNAIGVRKRLIPCHSYNESDAAREVLAVLDGGGDVAYCSDAGTPGISDPGARLSEAVRERGEHVVSPIPGPSAMAALVSASGNIGKAFTFEGFLSPKKGRREKRLKELIGRGDAFIVYESPFRIVKTIEDIVATGGVSRLTLGREMTKIHEEFISGTPLEVLEALKKKDAIKGEIAFVAVPKGKADDDIDQED